MEGWYFCYGSILAGIVWIVMLTTQRVRPVLATSSGGRARRDDPRPPSRSHRWFLGRDVPVRTGWTIGSQSGDRRRPALERL